MTYDSWDVPRGMLSVRIVNALYNVNVRTAGDLLDLQVYQIYLVKNMGWKSLWTVTTWLVRVGLVAREHPEIRNEPLNGWLWTPKQRPVKTPDHGLGGAWVLQGDNRLPGQDPDQVQEGE